MKILTGHDSQETAYLVTDYPYGFRLRCQMKVWIETNSRGQRFVTQTSNPKRPGTWNKPKCSTYSELVVMYLDEVGHVSHDAISLTYSDEAKWNEFAAKYAAGLTSKRATDLLKLAPIVFEARKHIKFTITPGPIERIV